MSPVHFGLKTYKQTFIQTFEIDNKMRKQLFILFGLLISNMLEAQTWSEFDVGTEENLNKVYFINDTSGFIIGSNGLVIKTFDAGDTWEPITTDAQHDLQTISFANEEVGYINGLKTIDGGTTWTSQPTSEIYGFMYAYDENRIMAGHGSMFDGTIYESNDGGLSWLPHWGHPGLTMFNDCDFVNQDEGYLSSWYAGHLFKTIDAGANWSEIVIDEVDGNGWVSDDYRSVAFPSQNLVLVTHEDGLLKTLDGGSTWSEIIPDSISQNNFYAESVIALSTQHYLLLSRGVSTLGASPTIYETSDGGVSWTGYANTVEYLRDVACNTSYCWAVGSNGIVYRRDNLINSVLENVKKIDVVFFPNPVRDILSVAYPKEIAEVKIYDAAGQLHHNISNNDESISVSHLKSGLYIIEMLFSDGEIVGSKFIKE